MLMIFFIIMVAAVTMVNFTRIPRMLDDLWMFFFEPFKVKYWHPKETIKKKLGGGSLFMRVWIHLKKVVVFLDEWSILIENFITVQLYLLPRKNFWNWGTIFLRKNNPFFFLFITDSVLWEGQTTNLTKNYLNYPSQSPEFIKSSAINEIFL